MLTTVVETRFGPLRLVSDGQSLTEVLFSEEPVDKNWREDGGDLPIFAKAKKWLDAYYNGEKPPITSLNLNPTGTPFQLATWELLKEIPYGEVVTYGTLAKQLGLIFGKEKMSAQAVGQAVGANPLPIIVPCHRVVGAHNNLTGYAGGLDRKVALLSQEGLSLGEFYYPKK